MSLRKKEKELENLSTKKAIHYQLLIERVRNLIYHSSFSEEEIFKKQRGKNYRIYIVVRHLLYSILKEYNYSYYDLSFIFGRSPFTIRYAINNKKKYIKLFNSLTFDPTLKITTYENFYAQLKQEDVGWFTTSVLKKKKNKWAKILHQNVKI